MKFLRFILFPITIIYDLVTRIRNLFFDIGIFKTSTFDIPIIAVGNLSVGGTGKTPQIDYLISLLKNEYKVAVLSRGYGRETKGYFKLNESHNASDVGDEPLQLYKNHKNDITVAVDANRTNGISQLIKTDQPDIILLDDAFQHRHVKASKYILLTRYNDLYIDDFVLPAGNLREHSSGAKRADIIIVTKCPEGLSKIKQKEIQQRLHLKKNQILFFSTIVYDKNIRGNQSKTINELKHKKIVLVTGIANTKSLENYLIENKITFKHLKYPDHHNFSDAEIKKIKELSTSNIILTTEKDHVRLYDKIEGILYIKIRTEFVNKKQSFDKTIEKVITKK